MPDIIDLSQTAANGDRLGFQWINAVRDRISSLEQQLAIANQTIQDLKAQTAQAFRVSVISGLSLAYLGGQLKVKTSGIILTIAPGNLTAPANATSYVQIDMLGAVSVSTTRPSSGFEVARVVTDATSVLSVENYPLIEARGAEPDLSTYATIEYADSRSWNEVAVGKKTSSFSIPGTDTYYRIPLEALSGSGFATSGLFTAPATGRYVFSSRIRVDTLSPSNPLAVKLSLFVSGTEYLLHQGDSAYGDLSASVQNNEPVTLNQGSTADMRVYLTRGTLARVRENSSVVVWQVP
jgi:hypothetical protein